MTIRMKSKEYRRRERVTRKNKRIGRVTDSWTNSRRAGKQAKIVRDITEM
jgi:hypothetical protein